MGGFVHIYYGDGKGKTTAGIGLAVRVVGNGGRVLMFQFLKNNLSSEINILSKMDNFEILKGLDDVKFSIYMNDDERKEATEFYRERFNILKEKCKKERYDLLFLDEIIDCCNCGFIDKREVIDFIENRPFGLEIVMTGRNPDSYILKTGDYITEMKKIKHPYDNGVLARKGIES